MKSKDRVRAVAEMLTQLRSASWVADQAQVDYRTARKYLTKLVKDDRLLTTERGQTTRYYPNPREQFFGEIGDLVDDHTKNELTAVLETISKRIETWQDEYNVEDVDELRTTLDESLSVPGEGSTSKLLKSYEGKEEIEDAFDDEFASQTFEELVNPALRDEDSDEMM